MVQAEAASLASQHMGYLLHLADNALILGQRNAEWCGHGPVLEEDIAMANISLDLIGQARFLYPSESAKVYDDANHSHDSKVSFRFDQRDESVECISKGFVKFEHNSSAPEEGWVC